MRLGSVRNGRRLLGVAFATLVVGMLVAGLLDLIGGERWVAAIAALIFGCFMALADRRWNIFDAPVSGEPGRISEDLTHAALLTANPMFVVLSTQHWHPAVTVASLAGVAIAGAGIMWLAERHRVARSGPRARQALESAISLRH